MDLYVVEHSQTVPPPDRQQQQQQAAAQTLTQMNFPGFIVTLQKYYIAFDNKKK